MWTMWTTNAGPSYVSEDISRTLQPPTCDDFASLRHAIRDLTGAHDYRHTFSPMLPMQTKLLSALRPTTTPTVQGVLQRGSQARVASSPWQTWQCTTQRFRVQSRFPPLWPNATP